MRMRPYPLASWHAPTCLNRRDALMLEHQQFNCWVHWNPTNSCMPLSTLASACLYLMQAGQGCASEQAAGAGYSLSNRPRGGFHQGAILIDFMQMDALQAEVHMFNKT